MWQLEGVVFWCSTAQVHEQCVSSTPSQKQPVLTHTHSLTDLKVESGQEWPALFQVLTEFCGCSLDQSISRDLIEAGDEEHLARVSHS